MTVPRTRRPATRCVPVADTSRRATAVGGAREPASLADASRPAAVAPGAAGQASVLLVGGLAGLLVAALIVGVVARAVGREAAAQRAADLAALAGARVMHENFGRLFEPAMLGRRPNPRHLDKAEYLALGRSAAAEVARANGAPEARIEFPDSASIAPARIGVAVRQGVRVGKGKARHVVAITARAEAALGPSADALLASGGGYDGPLAYRQGKPMRPDVAMAFDRMEAAARADGVTLLITSAYRSDAEQEVLWERHPDPKWVARPGTSLHRNATELDLGPRVAYAWLAAHAGAFHFIQRYGWEPWHYGFALNARSRPRAGASGGDAPAPGAAGSDGAAGIAHGAVPSFAPAAFAPMLAGAARRWNVSAALLAAQLYAESSFNPFARSSAGALGIAQFMPATARAVGLDDPLDPAQAIDAQAHLMRDLLQRFGSVPLALAAYNAGPGAVAACGCVPQNGETPGYVIRIIGLMSGAGQPIVPGGGEALAVRLVK